MRKWWRSSRCCVGHPQHSMEPSSTVPCSTAAHSMSPVSLVSCAQVCWSIYISMFIIGFCTTTFMSCLCIVHVLCLCLSAALSKLGFREVVFGCDNDRFGGNGSILSIHTIGSRNQVSNNIGYVSSSNTSSNSNGGLNMEDSDSMIALNSYSSSQYHAYPVRRGVLKEAAIAIFQQFYLSENRRAPESKRKRKAPRPWPPTSSSSTTTDSVATAVAVVATKES